MNLNFLQNGNHNNTEITEIPYSMKHENLESSVIEILNLVAADEIIGKKAIGPLL